MASFGVAVPVVQLIFGRLNSPHRKFDQSEPCCPISEQKNLVVGKKLQLKIFALTLNGPHKTTPPHSIPGPFAEHT